MNTPLKRWIKASNILGGKTGHTTKMYHKDALCDMDTFVSRMANPGVTIKAHIDHTLVQRIADNRHVKKVAEAVLFFGRQCIALRGDEETRVTSWLCSSSRLHLMRFCDNT